MSSQQIAARLKGTHYPPGEAQPSPEHYQTWPEQAALLARGEYEALSRWQAAWGTRRHSQEVNSPRSEGTSLLLLRHCWLLVALLMIFASLLSYLLAPPCHVCAYGCKEPTTRKTERLDLSIDTLFDYNQTDPYGELHRSRVRSQLRDIFSKRSNITVQKIEAHTDPIGSTHDNTLLGQARAKTVLELINELMSDPAIRPRFLSRDLPVRPDEAGPDKEDAAFWDYCFRRFQINESDARFRPLRDLDSEKNKDKRTLCSRATIDEVAGAGFPACASPYDREKMGDSSIFAQKAEHFRELTACLSPMRHVSVTIQYDSVPSSSLAPSCCERNSP